MESVALPLELDENIQNNTSARPLRILVVSVTFPSAAFPNYGVFVKERVKAVSQLPGIDVRVIAPVPYFPKIKGFERWSHWAEAPHEETVDGLQVTRPRYFLPPKLGGFFHGDLLYPAVKRAARKIHQTFPFDVIDAHFVHPSGVAAVRLGKAFNVPVIMTGRGEDMLKFPQSRLKGPRIRWAIRNAAHCVAVSREIAESFKANGAAPNKISVIPNGVDTEKFHPIPMHEARQKLGLPPDAKIIVTVGDRVERKGFHIAVDAMPKVLEQFPSTRLLIVGGPGQHGRDFTKEIERRIQSQNLGEHVRLVGRKPHHELKTWYSAADLFALLSSREGSPNVLLEALACGTPAVATPVGGIADELADPKLGLIVPTRSATETARVITQALGTNWDREQIRLQMEGRSWKKTALRVWGSIVVQKV